MARPRSAQIALIQVLAHYSGFRTEVLPRRAALILADILSDESKPETSRACAAEALRNILRHVDMRVREFRTAVGSLLTALGSPSPAVRFFSVFALGELKEKRAVEQIKRIAIVDDAICPGLPPEHGTISEEARRVLTYFTGRPGV